MTATESGVAVSAALGEPPGTTSTGDREDDREDRDPEQWDEQEEESEIADPGADEMGPGARESECCEHDVCPFL